MKTELYNGEKFTHEGLTFRVSYLPEDFPEYPWENSDYHGPVRCGKAHNWANSDKRPGERPLNWANRHEYQFYYDWQEAMKRAKAEAWGPTPLEAVQCDFDRLRGFIAGDWCYLTVKVECLKTGEASYLGMVESDGDYKSEVAYDLADELAHEYRRSHRRSHRFADAMACGV